MSKRRRHGAWDEPIPAKPPGMLPVDDKAIPEPEYVEVEPIMRPKLKSKSSTTIFGVPFVRKVARQVKWGAVLVVVLPIVNVALGMAGLPSLDAADVESWGAFAEWLALAVPVVVGWVSTVIIGWLTRPAEGDGVEREREEKP
jgi:hypothetical protein